MPARSPENHLTKKAYELSYALFRVAEYAKNKGFAGYLEDKSLRLLHYASEGDRIGLKNETGSLEYFIRFGADVGIISQKNSSILLRELENLNPAIAGLVEDVSLPDIEIESIFTKSASRTLKVKRVDPAIRQQLDIHPANDPAPVKSSQNPASIESSSLEIAIDENNGEVRQSMILEKIGQTGNCRFKDIQELMPEISERTLRYDLQSLVEKNLVERIGTSGPATYYRLGK